MGRNNFPPKSSLIKFWNYIIRWVMFWQASTWQFVLILSNILRYCVWTATFLFSCSEKEMSIIWDSWVLLPVLSFCSLLFIHMLELTYCEFPSTSLSTTCNSESSGLARNTSFAWSTCNVSDEPRMAYKFSFILLY